MSGEKKERHRNIPIFIPHLGCPHQCTFCDQRAISGHEQFVLQTAKQEIAAGVAGLSAGQTAEIAFFGGSFTAIDRSLMLALLREAQQYIEAGKVSGIRFSTRPDAVGDEVLDALMPFTVSAIELGLQSMDDEVLFATKRGHTAAVAREACRRVIKRGYPLVGQMMIGLPKSTPEKEWATAQELVALGVCAVRIYPTVVFEGTQLANEWRAGTYCPPDSAQAAERCVPLLAYFRAHQVEVLRIGLCASEALRSSAALAGGTHPALGEMVYSAVYAQRVQAQLESMNVPTDRRACVQVSVSRGKLSQALGQKRENIFKWKQRFPYLTFTVREADQLKSDELDVRLISE